MFPSNLHKNILQLDRQISLLENECKSMETDKRKKNINFKPPHSKCSRGSNLQLKSPPVKDNIKKSGYCYDGSKRTKKFNSPVSSRLQSTSSLPSNCTKTWSGNGVPSVENEAKQCRVNTNFHVCSCQLIDNANIHCNSRKENRCVKCVCCNEELLSDLSKKNVKLVESCSNNSDEKNVDKILHKEVFFSNPGGAIEVTVTQKSNDDNQKENVPFKKIITLNKEGFEKGVENYRYQSRNGSARGQKWSEILCLESAKRAANCSTSTVNQNAPDETKVICEPMCSTMNNIFAKEETNIHNSSTKNEIVSPPIKLINPSPRIKKQSVRLKTSRPEGEIHSHQDYREYRDSLVQFSEDNMLKMFQYLIQELKEKPSEKDRQKVLTDVETAVKKALCNQPVNKLPKPAEEKTANWLQGLQDQQHDLVPTVQKICDNLMREKELLSQELVTKENTIAALKKREEEYLSLISTLKSNLEKTKGNAQEGISTTKELNVIKLKLLEQVKVSEALKKSHTKLQEIMEQCALENDSLKTQIQIFRLEAKKHDVLLAGKEAEIQRYKEEIENFQRQISDHLASLKSKAQAVDIEKMMEAIIHESQIFIQTDLDSVILEKDAKDSPRLQNGLMHSSPTSTKPSVVNSSWKQISSIREHDQVKDVVKINVNRNQKNFYPIFGQEVSDSEPCNNALLREKLIAYSKQAAAHQATKQAEKEVKRKSSFTSCASMQEGEGNDDADDCDQVSKEITSKNEKPIAEVETIKHSPRKVVNIDELLQNMKLQWSERIYGGTSVDERAVEDLFNASQISSISRSSEKPPYLEIP